MFKAGHSKSAVDAVGGVIKRTAHDTLKMDNDIRLFNVLKDKTAVKMFFIEETSVNEINKMIPTNARTIADTMQQRGESDETLAVSFNKDSKMTGKKRYYTLMHRHPELSLREPESTSMARAQGFN